MCIPGINALGCAPGSPAGVLSTALEKGSLASTTMHTLTQTKNSTTKFYTKTNKRLENKQSSQALHVVAAVCQASGAAPPFLTRLFQL